MKIVFLILMLLLGIGIFYSYETYETPINIDEELQKVGTKEYFETNIQNFLLQGDMESAQEYSELASKINISLSKQIEKDLSQKNEKNLITMVSENGKDIYQGFVNGKMENQKQFYASIASDMTVVGDIRDFYKEGLNYINNEPYSEWILGLSAVGIGLSAGQIMAFRGSKSLDASVTTSLKMGSSVLKISIKTGKLSKEFLEVLKEKISKTVDFQILKNEVDFKSIASAEKSLKSINKAFDLSHIKGITQSVDTIKTNTSIYETTKLLEYVKSEQDLKKLADISSKYKNNTKTIFKVLGKGILKATKLAVKISAWLIFQIIGFIISLLGFLFSRYLISFVRKENKKLL